jgi:HEPN domain-containing protein
MTPKADPSDPQAWLRHARSNLQLAERGKRLKGVLLEDLCFNAQQAAEKAFKAICIARNIDFPKTHSLVRLIDILEENGMSIPESIKAADILTQFAVQSRYPDWIEEITKEEYSEAIQLAAQVVFWVEKYLSTKE